MPTFIEIIKFAGVVLGIVMFFIGNHYAHKTLQKKVEADDKKKLDDAKAKARSDRERISGSLKRPPR